LNDDFLLTSAVEPGDFFQNDGTMLFPLTRTSLDNSPMDRDHPIFHARSRSVQLALAAGFPVTRRYIQHSPYPMRKSVLAQVWSAWPDAALRTSRSRFRSSEDVIFEWLHNSIAVGVNMGCWVESKDYAYINLNSRKGAFLAMSYVLAFSDVKFTCLNDGDDADDELKRKWAIFRAKSFLKFLDFALKP